MSRTDPDSTPRSVTSGKRQRCRLGSKSPAAKFGSQARDLATPLESFQQTAQESRLALGQFDTTWTNPVHPSDVSGDGFIAPLDALAVVNSINENGARFSANGLHHSWHLTLMSTGMVSSLPKMLEAIVSEIAEFRMRRR